MGEVENAGERVSPDVGHEATGDPSRIVGIDSSTKEHGPDQPERAEQREAVLWNKRLTMHDLFRSARHCVRCLWLHWGKTRETTWTKLYLLFCHLSGCTVCMVPYGHVVLTYLHTFCFVKSPHKLKTDAKFVILQLLQGSLCQLYFWLQVLLLKESHVQRWSDFGLRITVLKPWHFDWRKYEIRIPTSCAQKVHRNNLTEAIRPCHGANKLSMQLCNISFFKSIPECKHQMFVIHQRNMPKIEVKSSPVTGVCSEIMCSEFNKMKTRAVFFLLGETFCTRQSLMNWRPLCHFLHRHTRFCVRVLFFRDCGSVHVRTVEQGAVQTHTRGSGKGRRGKLPRSGFSPRSRPLGESHSYIKMAAPDAWTLNTRIKHHDG